jgi:hypothetical protein
MENLYELRASEKITMAKNTYWCTKYRNTTLGKLTLFPQLSNDPKMNLSFYCRFYNTDKNGEL